MARVSFANRRGNKVALLLVAVVLLLVNVLVGFEQNVGATSVGPNSPTAAANNTALAGTAWTSPTNAETSNGAYAAVTLSKNANSEYLEVSGFGFSIPTNATINGIEADVEVEGNNANLIDDSVVAYNPATTTYSTSQATSSALPTTLTYVTYGGSTSLWGTTWTPAAINNSSFAIDYAVKNKNTKTSSYVADVDYIRVTISYTVPSFNETSYEWYQNANSVSSPLTSLAAQNTTATAPVPGTPFRLRLLVAVSAASDPLSGQAFTLQYASNGTNATCSLSFSGVTYADVTSSSPISFYTGNTSLTDGMNISALTGDPTDGSNTIVPEQYMDSNTYFNNSHTAINTSQDGEWDVALNDTSASPGYYCFRVVLSGGSVINTYTDLPTLYVADQPPTSPSGLTQSTTSTLSNGGWTNQSPINFSGTASSGNYTDTLKLCVEVEPNGTPFTNTNTSCGSGVSYTGSPVTISDSYASLTSGTQYNWQARTEDANSNYSSWVAYGTAPNFGYETSAPSTGTVYDGTSSGVEQVFNNGSLSQLSANWSGFSALDGIASYSYSIGTSPGGTSVLGWTTTTSTSVTTTGLTLHTGQTYYFNVKATDNAGNVSAVVSSSGQVVAPTVSLGISPTTLTFNNLSASNPTPWTDSETTTLTASSNAYNGFNVYAYLAQPLTAGSFTIPAFNGGTYASPNTWVTGDTGFGYTSSATSINGSNIFQVNPCPGGAALVSPGCFAPYSTTAPGDIVAQQASGVTGSAVTDTFTITDRVTVTDVQAAKTYTGVIVYSIAPSF